MLSPTPDSLSGGYAPSEPARPKSATRQHDSRERTSAYRVMTRRPTNDAGECSYDTHSRGTS